MTRAERTAVKRDIRRRKACTRHHPPREKDTMETNEVTRTQTEHHEIQVRFPGEEGWFTAERVEPGPPSEASLAMWRSLSPDSYRLVKVTTWTEVETEVLG